MAKVLTGHFSRRGPKKMQQVSADEPLPGYRLKLAVAFSDPLIWRRIQVPGRMTLAGLHAVVQVCMGWDNSGSHQFLVGKIFYQSALGSAGKKQNIEYDEKSVALYQLEEGMQFLFTYFYDGGEGWELEITLEEVIRNGLKDDVPFLLGGERACPPAEVGDIHHYQALLAAAEASGGASRHNLDLPMAAGFDPERFDRQAIKHLLAELK